MAESCVRIICEKKEGALHPVPLNQIHSHLPSDQLVYGLEIDSRGAENRHGEPSEKQLNDLVNALVSLTEDSAEVAPIVAYIPFDEEKILEEHIYAFCIEKDDIFAVTENIRLIRFLRFFQENHKAYLAIRKQLADLDIQQDDPNSGQGLSENQRKEKKDLESVLVKFRDSMGFLQTMLIYMVLPVGDMERMSEDFVAEMAINRLVIPGYTPLGHILDEEIPGLIKRGIEMVKAAEGNRDGLAEQLAAAAETAATLRAIEGQTKGH